MSDTDNNELVDKTEVAAEETVSENVAEETAVEESAPEAEQEPAVEKTAAEETAEDNGEASVAEPEVQPAEEEEKSSGGLFSKLKQQREARMDAAVDNGEYDIFDLEDILDIRLEEEDLYDDIPSSNSAEENVDASQNGTDSSDTKHRSIFSKLKDKISTTESPDETPAAEESGEESAEADAEKEEVGESVGEQSEESAEEPAEEAVEEEPEEEYVSPLDEMESFSSETSAAMDSINELFASLGIPTMDTGSVEESKEETVEEIVEEIIEETGSDSEKTKHISTDKVVATAKRDKIEAEDNGQIVLEGFADDEPDEVDESEVEESLKSRRKSIIENFQVFADGKSDDHSILENETAGTSDVTEDAENQNGESIFESIDKASRKNKSFFGAVKNRENKQQEEDHILTIAEIKKQCAADLKRLNVTTKVLLVLTVLLGVLSLVGSMTVPESGVLSVILGSGARIYTAVNLILYLICVVISFSSFTNAFRSTLAKNIDSKTVFLVANVVVTLQMIVALAAGVNEKSGMVVYGFVGAMTILAEAFTERRNCITLQKSISTMTKSDLRGIQPIEKKDDSAALGYDLSPSGDPSIYYSTNAKIPENISKLTKETSFEGDLITKLTIAAVIASVLVDVAACVVNGSAWPIYNVLPCGILLMLPVFRPYVLSIFKHTANKDSIVKGVAVLSYDECDEVAHSNAVVLDSNELLSVNVSDFKKAGKSRIAKSDAVVYTAAILRASDSMLSGCFNEYLKQIGIDLPPVTEFHYEEKLGFFGVIGGVRVIVGTRKCLELHSIECPTEEEEKQYCSNGIVLYTSVQEKIVSTFIVRYSAKRNIKKQIEEMYRTGIVIMLRCCEPSLTDESVADILGCSPVMIKIASSRGNDIVKTARESQNIYKDNGILCIKKKNSLLYSVAAACGLSSQRRNSRNVQVALSILWIVLFLLVSVFKISIAYNPVTVVVFEVVAAAISYLIGKIGNK